MLEWYQELALDLQIFYAFGILATLLLVIQLVMTVFGAGEDVAMGDFDALDGADAGHGSGLGLLSTRTIVAFLAGFGWTGAMARGGGMALVPSVLVALAVGFVLMLLVFWLMRWLFSLRGSGSLDYRNAVGGNGTVYVTIPAAGGGTGQIQLVVQGRLATVAASTLQTESIPSGRSVKVTALLGGNILQVETI
ncbi:hypothetical protein KJ682_11165 [bacterium]|nr:hypothetical protein [bacterium]